MTKKRRYLISAAVLTACVCAAWIVISMLPAGPAVTRANFDRIKDGMTFKEVQAILGEPVVHLARHNNEIDPIIWLWSSHFDGSRIVVRFVADKADEKTFDESTETLHHKLRRWLRLPQ